MKKTDRGEVEKPGMFEVDLKGYEYQDYEDNNDTSKTDPVSDTHKEEDTIEEDIEQQTEGNEET